MNIVTNYSKAVWLPLIFVVAFMSFNTSLATGQQIQWNQDLAEAKALARDTNRLVWLHFSADWCAPCKRLESFVFSNTGVIRAADRNTVAVKIDADAEASLVKQLAVPRIPYDVMMTPSGRVIVSRPSPKNSSDFLTMLNSLDRPLQALNSGDREVINGQIDKLNGVIQRTGGNIGQQKNDLNIDGPSHQMASTTVEGQRLARGFESSKRASEIRAIEAKLLKQKAQLYIAEEEKRLKVSQGPKVSENPFYKPAGGSSTLPVLKRQSNAFATGSPKTISNSFVKQQSKSEDLQLAKTDSAFTPPLPPAFETKNIQQEAVASDDDLTLYNERDEFSFSLPEDIIKPKTTQKAPVKPSVSLAAPKMTLPKFAERSGEKAAGNDFAYASMGGLQKPLRSKTDQSISQKSPTALKSFDNPVNKSSQGPLSTRPPKFGLTAKHQAANTSQPAFARQRPVTKKPVAAFAEFEQPTMKTAVSIPQAPAMMEGVVKIAETTVPAVEGRLVAAEQTIDTGSSGSKVQSVDTIQKQISRTDRLLENVNFFAPDEEQVQSAPHTFAIPGRQVPQPQIVINLNTGNTASPQPASQGGTIQPNLVARGNPSNKVALASSTVGVANRPAISKPDIASEVRSKYALKGKCPVTLLTKGRWVDGNKQIGCVHRDRVYLFASAADREAFLAAPDKLSPLLAGFDPVIFEETGKLIEGEENFGTFMGKKPNQRIVLFKTADTLERFQKDPSKYLDVVRKAMANKAR